jgi:pimeloyl-[acyl-carrier protein] methyl ester esterase
MSSLYVETRGKGPDLVLLHGWGLNLRVWDGLAGLLEKSFRIIAVDLPGHGRSEWNPKARTPAEQAWQVHATLESLTDRYSLLGWSLGGQIALDLAAAMPGRVEHLVLVATTPRFAASPDWPYGMPATALERMATQLKTNYKRTVSDFLELQVRGSTGAEKALADLHASLFEHGEAHPKALVAGLATLESSDLRPMLPLVRAPTLVVAGQYDRVTLPAASRALAEALPDARYIEIHRAAHAPFLSHTAEFATLVTEFLRGESHAASAGANTAALANIAGKPAADASSEASPHAATRPDTQPPAHAGANTAALANIASKRVADDGGKAPSRGAANASAQPPATGGANAAALATIAGKRLGAPSS